METNQSVGGPNRRSRLRSLLDTVATLTMIVTAIVLMTRSSSQTASPRRPTEVPVPAEPIELAGLPTRGNSAARVIVVEFSDFQCPFCRKFSTETLPEIERSYITTGKVKLAFHHLPLPIHSQAELAAEAAECAGRQGRFWEMHDGNFAHSNELDEASLKRRARSLGLNGETFDSCLAGEATDLVHAYVAAAKHLGISGTPVFFFGTADESGRLRVARTLSGARPLADFTAILDQLLTR